jgi:hypothetical protein
VAFGLRAAIDSGWRRDSRYAYTWLSGLYLLRRAKKRRVINQPLSELALEIPTESMGNYDFRFCRPLW